MRQVVPPEQIGPGRWLLPRLPPSDPAALRRLAADCRELQAVLGEVARDAESVVADLRRGWSGAAASQAPAPLLTLRDDLAVVGRALDVFATELERLAAALAVAEEEHGWSWSKVAVVSAVVAVTAVAVVVTIGSAGTASPGAAAAETAVISAAAGEMAAASVAAASAEAAAVEGLMVAARLARTVEALRAIVVPRADHSELHGRRACRSAFGWCGYRGDDDCGDRVRRGRTGQPDGRSAGDRARCQRKRPAGAGPITRISRADIRPAGAVEGPGAAPSVAGSSPSALPAEGAPVLRARASGARLTRSMRRCSASRRTTTRRPQQSSSTRCKISSPGPRRCASTEHGRRNRPSSTRTTTRG